MCHSPVSLFPPLVQMEGGTSLHQKVSKRPRSSLGQGLESTVRNLSSPQVAEHHHQDAGLELGLLTAHCWAPLALGERDDPNSMDLRA